MTTITKLIKHPHIDFHTAVGYTYIIELSNGERFQITEDELIKQFQLLYWDRNYPDFIQSLIGKVYYSNEEVQKAVRDDMKNSDPEDCY